VLRKPASIRDIVSQSPAAVDLRNAFDSAFPWAADTDTGTGTGSGEGGSGDGKTGTDTGTGETGAGEGETGSEDKDVKDPEKKRLSDEAAKHRTEKKVAEQERDTALAKLKEYEDQNKSELEKAQRDAKEFKEKVTKLETKVSDMVVKLAFFESGSAALFKNAATGLRLIDLDGVTVDDDGKVDVKAIKAKAEALLKEQPYLAADGDSSGSAGETGSEASGRANNGKKDSSKVDYEALAKKFPALRR
jgi:hypothetical protein